LEWVLILAAASGWTLVAVLMVVLPSRARRGSQQAVLRLRAHVEPYLLRRAADVQLDPAPGATDPTAAADEILDNVCALADRLIERERHQVALGDTMNIAVSDTMPLQTNEVLKAEKLGDDS